jgi:hypothetical protein
MKRENLLAVAILLRKSPSPHFSARNSLNYEILSEMFFRCVIHNCMLLINSALKFPRHSTTVFIFDSYNENLI